MTTQAECWHCGDARHETTDCKRHALMRPPANPATPLTQALTYSLNGASRGRRIGWILAQSKAAQIALHGCKDSEEGLRIFNLIMNLQDNP